MRRTLLASLLLVAAFALSIGLDWLRTLTAADSGSSSAPFVTVGISQTQRAMDTLQARVAQRPSDSVAHLDLGLAFLQRARETADPSYYSRADAALSRAQELNPADPDTLVALGTLALARHQFQYALAQGEKAKELNPFKASAYGVIGDALVELGRYEESFVVVQHMVDLRPDLASYTRVSYLRELQGDLPGAIEAMRLAVGVGASTGEHTAWTRVQLGNLFLQTGARAEAEREYRWALAADPANMAAVAGLGRTLIARGDYAGAIPHFERATTNLPLPELVVTLGDLYESVGREEDAKRQFDLARALQTLISTNGGNVDLELALFEADRGDPVLALALARAEVARRSSVQVYDVLAWALYRNGQFMEAHQASQKALSLGTRDSLILFHAAMIENSLDFAG